MTSALDIAVIPIHGFCFPPVYLALLVCARVVLSSGDPSLFSSLLIVVVSAVFLLDRLKMRMKMMVANLSGLLKEGGTLVLSTTALEVTMETVTVTVKRFLWRD